MISYSHYLQFFCMFFDIAITLCLKVPIPWFWDLFMKFHVCSLPYNFQFDIMSGNFKTNKSIKTKVFSTRIYRANEKEMKKSKIALNVVKRLNIRKFFIETNCLGAYNVK